MRIAARHRPSWGVVHACRIERIAVLAEGQGRKLRIVCVRLHDTDRVRHGLFAQLLRREALRAYEIGVYHPHGQPQLHRVGKTAPFHGCAGEDVVGRARDAPVDVLVQQGDCLVQFIEHLRIDLGLVVVSHLDLTGASDLGIRNRAISVRHTVQDADLHDLEDGQNERILRNPLHVRHVTVQLRDDFVAVHEHVRPVVGRVVFGNGVRPAIVRISVITALRTAQQTVSELRRIDIRRDDGPEHGRESRGDGVVLGLHLLLVHLVGIAVDVEVILGACAQNAHNCEGERRFYQFVFHRVAVLEFETEIESYVAQ